MDVRVKVSFQVDETHIGSCNIPRRNALNVSMTCADPKLLLSFIKRGCGVEVGWFSSYDFQHFNFFSLLIVDLQLEYCRKYFSLV